MCDCLRVFWSNDLLQVDTTDILFVCGGAFSGLEKIISARGRAASIGFGAKVAGPDDRKTGEIFREVEPEDLLKYGLIPEFVGRLPVLATLEDRDEPALKRILLEPKNALVKQYRRLFEMESVDLALRDLDLGPPRDRCNYIPRGGTRLCRASLRRRYRLAPWPRFTFNSLRHIDPIGTILLPAVLLFLRSPFLFGYAKPAPISFGALRNPRRDKVLVAAAGPGINIVLAVIAALLFHFVGYLPDTAAQWVAENLKNALSVNVVLAVFNLLPLPPLDGGRTPWDCLRTSSPARWLG